MISAIAADQPVPGGTYMPHRPSRSERAILADSAPPAREDADARNNRQSHRDHTGTPAQPEAPRRDSSSMFAAAVIAGALPPVPQTMEELMRRIGTSPIPEESEARLRDLMA